MLAPFLVMETSRNSKGGLLIDNSMVAFRHGILMVIRSSVGFWLWWPVFCSVRERFLVS